MIKRAYTITYDDGYSEQFEEEVVAYNMADRFLTAYLDGEVVYIHRLVAELFVKNPKNYRYVLHADGNRMNNSSDNLVWSASSANTALRSGQKTGYPILCTTTGKKYISIQRCAIDTGIDYYKLRNAILSGKEIDGLSFKFD